MLLLGMERTKMQQRQHANSILYVWTQRFKSWRNWEGWRRWFGLDSQSFLCVGCGSVGRKWDRGWGRRRGTTAYTYIYRTMQEQLWHAAMVKWPNVQTTWPKSMEACERTRWLVLGWAEIKTNKGDNGSNVGYYLGEQGSGPEAVGGG